MPELPVFHTTRRVEFSDTDMAGIMHFARFFHYMEQVEHEFLRSRGLSVIMHWEGQDLGFPRVSSKCDYEMPVRFQEVIDITLDMKKLGTKSITYEFRFAKEGQPVATGTLIVCCCVMDEQQRLTSIPIPDTFKARLLGA
jgi:4-hydroxybenzoyl-CoA thioesterase/acyl-CoA thioester hydrolase